MIHLDTNYLIGLLVKGSAQAIDVDGWLAAGDSLAASAIAWTEFLNGPITPSEISSANAVLQSRIIPFGPPEAALAAELFAEYAILNVRVDVSGGGTLFRLE